MFQHYSQFYKDSNTEQQTHEAVDVTHWVRGNDAPYPVGAREKSLKYAPQEIIYQFLIPKHRYLLKMPRMSRNWQFWHEIIAYKLGRILDIPVPPAFDNGTSMGYERRPQDIANFNIERYNKKGVHHMKYSLDDQKRAGHAELLKKVAADTGHYIIYMKHCLLIFLLLGCVLNLY